jgi:hypothetical protein
MTKVRRNEQHGPAACAETASHQPGAASQRESVQNASSKMRRPHRVGCRDGRGNHRKVGSRQMKLLVFLPCCSNLGSSCAELNPVAFCSAAVDAPARAHLGMARPKARRVHASVSHGGVRPVEYSCGHERALGDPCRDSCGGHSWIGSATHEAEPRFLLVRNARASAGASRVVRRCVDGIRRRAGAVRGCAGGGAT